MPPSHVRRTSSHWSAEFEVNCSLREAHDATSSQRLLRDEFAQDIITMYNLVRQASLRSAAAAWIGHTLSEAIKAKAARADLSLSYHSVDRTRSRRREDPSNGQGASKQATFRTTSDSDSSQPPSRRPSRQGNPRQVHHCLHHDSDSPLFLPSIAHQRTRTPPT